MVSQFTCKPSKYWNGFATNLRRNEIHLRLSRSHCWQINIGIKVWVNCYVCGFRVSVRKQGNNTKMGLGINVVMELTHVIAEKSILLLVKTKAQTKKHVLLTLYSTTSKQEVLIVMINSGNTSYWVWLRNHNVYQCVVLFSRCCYSNCVHYITIHTIKKSC